MPKKTPIGEKIFFLRKALELTQGALGEQIGVTRAAISQFEAGETLPSLSTLAKLSQALQFDLAQIWQASPNPSTAEDEHLLIPFFPISAYPSLISFTDPKLHDVSHTILTRVPVLRLPGVQYEVAAVVEINGDSLMPRYPHGSRYVTHPVGDLRFATGVHLFIFHRKTIMFRRIISNTGETIVLRADATGEEVSYPLAELARMRSEEDQCFMRKLGQGIHMPAEV